MIEETGIQRSKFKISTIDKEVICRADDDKVIAISEKEFLILEENWVIIIYDIAKYISKCTQVADNSSQTAGTKSKLNFNRFFLNDLL